jgi:hypothetical protein
MSENTLNLSDPRGPQGDRRERRPLALLGNGKAGWLKQALVGAALAALVSFAVTAWQASGQAKDLAAKTDTQIQTGLAVIEANQKTQYEAVLRELRELREDLRAERRPRRD